nr:hypothetical protein [Tanacetum cinerariifolium]
MVCKTCSKKDLDGCVVWFLVLNGKDPMMSADVARSHGGDGGGEDRPLPHHVPNGCMGCFANR